MDPNAALTNIREAITRDLNGMGDGDELTTTAETFQGLDEWLSKGGFLPTAWLPRRVIDEANDLYEMCAHCHLFVHENPAFEDGEGIARYVHSSRGDEADERLEDHDATPSGMKATLRAWRVFGPWQMRERFVFMPDGNGGVEPIRRGESHGSTR